MYARLVFSALAPKLYDMPTPSCASLVCNAGGTTQLVCPICRAPSGWVSTFATDAPETFREWQADLAGHEPKAASLRHEADALAFWSAGTDVFSFGVPGIGV